MTITLTPIPWTVVDGLLSMRMKGTTVNLTEDHPNFSTLVSSLKERKWRVVEALVYRMEKKESLVDRMAHFDAKKVTNDTTVVTATIPGSLPTLMLVRPEVLTLAGRIPTVVIDPIENRDAVIERLWNLALTAGRDTFAYQSAEEKFPGDLKVSVAGDVFEFQAKDENWVPLLKIVEG